ncbi:hypothetical protein AMATHDRAFT_68460 [Amanita thiersii Skay4041]|uniref:Uncharacterized protein n=1 Tax=Amanita thiersii Skay4041 TaxID=703135 RepID=A0A2A9NFR0_9AGAR|nr:hypothetical protein AMATHDRAFT_68460 [Amanita thiersii Skay4041]
MVADLDAVRVYTVNGAAAGSSSSLPDWLTRKRSSTKGKRARKEHVEGSLELIQGFEFPEASIKIKSTRDGHHAIATGVYKPQIRVWDLDHLTLKFERHSDAENVDFVILSDDWTKSIHLQNDRTIELHTQSGFHYRTRIPRFGRSLAYHFPSCDAYFAASGHEVYRLNLDQGRFMTPLSLQLDEGGDEGGEVVGVNVVDINPAHQLLTFGLEGSGAVQFWDPRSRSRVGVLRVPRGRLATPGLGSGAAGSLDGLDITAIASRVDGLSYAIGTSTGHTLLYDIRSSTPFALKDQGYGLPVKKIIWIEGGSRMAGDGMVLSADKKVVKIWDRNQPSSNFVSINPAQDLNDIHHIPGSGLFMTANEGIQMATYYIPQLGPAPKWASFLENITEEMEDQSVRSVYEDYKFVERNELKMLGLDHLVGTAALKPYMHGYFIQLKLYDAARVIANPFAYAEYREKMVREKMDKMAETRIRTKKDIGVKVNKALAEKILKEDERAKRRDEKKKRRQAEKDVASMDVDQEESGEEGDVPSTKTILNDPRFKAVFENPDYAIDENSREYALLNPSTVAQRRSGKTAVEEEEEESDKPSSDGLEDSDKSDNESSDDGGTSDSSEAGELNKFDPRARPGQKNERLKAADGRQARNSRVPKVNLVPMRADSSRQGDKNATFGQRRRSMASTQKSNKGGALYDELQFGEDGAMEVTWTPSASKALAGDNIHDGAQGGQKGGDKKGRRGGVEVFGAGMEKGVVEGADLSEVERKGRTQRRQGMRSGSKNVFRSFK